MSKSSEEGAGNAAAAGQDAAGGQKDAGNIYENREGTKKIIRVVTVMAYVFSVSFAAILLSAYYVFLWEPPNARAIQRHPLTGDPQAEYLTDNVLPISNSHSKLKLIKNVTKIEDSNLFNLMRKNVPREGQRVVKYRPELVAHPQELLAYEDLPVNDAPSTAGPPPSSATSDTEENGLSDNQTVNDEPGNGTSSLNPPKQGRQFIIWEKMTISSTKRYEDISTLPGIMNNETTPTSPRVYGYSYPQTVGDTAQYNKETTIENEVTTETSTQQAYAAVPELEENFHTSLRNHESRLSTDLEDQETGTTSSTPDVRIYPEESAREILKN